VPESLLMFLYMNPRDYAPAQIGPAHASVGLRNR
jgi:hypothetical protein